MIEKKKRSAKMKSQKCKTETGERERIAKNLVHI
jgi:hypothetical protein